MKLSYRLIVLFIFYNGLSESGEIPSIGKPFLMLAWFAIAVFIYPLSGYRSIKRWLGALLCASTLLYIDLIWYALRRTYATQFNGYNAEHYFAGILGILALAFHLLVAPNMMVKLLHVQKPALQCQQTSSNETPGAR